MFSILFSWMLNKACAVIISPAIPGVSQTGAGAPPGAWVANFYQFALLIGGILAFGAIVYGGVKSAFSAGNPSAVSEARSWIWSALIGLVLLGGAYIILRTINPNLINLDLPTLSPISNVQLDNGGATCSPSTCNGTCYAGVCHTDPSVCQSKGMCVDANSGNCVACATGDTNASCTAKKMCYSIITKTCISC